MQIGLFPFSHTTSHFFSKPTRICSCRCNACRKTKALLKFSDSCLNRPLPQRYMFTQVRFSALHENLLWNYTAWKYPELTGHPAPWFMPRLYRCQDPQNLSKTLFVSKVCSFMDLSTQPGEHGLYRTAKYEKHWIGKVSESACTAVGEDVGPSGSKGSPLARCCFCAVFLFSASLFCGIFIYFCSIDSTALFITHWLGCTVLSNRTDNGWLFISIIKMIEPNLLWLYRSLPRQKFPLTVINKGNESLCESTASDMI